MSNPKNFDEFYGPDRAFIVGGTTFHWRPVHWREWGKHLDDAAADAEKEEATRRKKEEKLKAEGKNEEEIEEAVADRGTVVDSFGELIDEIVLYIEESEIESFRAVLSDPGKRITPAQLRGLLDWLREVQSEGRPTNTPSPSLPGRGRSGVTSQAA